MINIKKGLALPIGGAPEAVIDDARPVRSAAVLGVDYPGMKPTMSVQEGDRVKRGDVLFSDKKNDGVVFTAPAAGTVSAIHRGEKRALLSVVIQIDGDEAVSFRRYDAGALAGLGRDEVIANLRDSGLWTALRTRPFSKVPRLDAVPRSIFVTAMDTNPLAGNPAPVIEARATEFAAGCDVLAQLTEGPVHICHAPGNFLPKGDHARLQTHEFGGVHPAGLPGTHIHFIDPVSAKRQVWFIGYQDVIAIGHLFLTGELLSERVVALGGPGASRPRMVRTILGADIEALTAGECETGEQRVISGSVLSGRTARGALAYLGRYHNQVSILPENRERVLLGYLAPGVEQHSVFPGFLSRWLGTKVTRFTTNTNGSERAMVPIGTYEAVMPHDILATQLLRAMLVGDIESAINLGVLELDEDDIALCTYACPGKYEFGPVLRNMLTMIEKEG